VPPGTISIFGVWSGYAPINSEKSTTELNGPHYTEFERLSNLTLDLAIHQHLGSLKQVINKIIWIRDTGCYRDHHIGILIKHRIQNEFYARLKHETKECLCGTRAHTSPKSHHVLNIW
jgi:hypothetical protein